LDGVKIFPFARSALQNKVDYNQGTAVIVGGANSNFLSDGLVGYWKMDEDSWTNDCSTPSVTDSSGN
jgi:hypothetical protein